MSVYWNTYLLPRRKMVSEVMDRARAAAACCPPGADPELLQDMIGGAIMYHLLVRPGHRSVKEMRVYIREVLHQIGIATVADRRRADSPEVGLAFNNRATRLATLLMGLDKRTQHGIDARLIAATTLAKPFEDVPVQKNLDAPCFW